MPVTGVNDDTEPEIHDAQSNLDNDENIEPAETTGVKHETHTGTQSTEITGVEIKKIQERPTNTP